MTRLTARTAVLIIFVVVSAELNLCPSSVWAQQVGTVSQLSGTVLLERAGSTGGAALGTAIQLHDQLTTAIRSAVTVTLADNTALSLSESSTLAFDENVVAGSIRQKTLVRLVEGGLRSLVTAALHSGAPTFQVQTPNAVVTSRGTDFDTVYIEGAIRPGYQGCQRYTDVMVREGVVGISNLANPSAEVEVGAGYETTVPCLLPPLNAGPLGITGAAAPGSAASGKSGGGSVGSAGAVSGFSAPPPGVGSSPPPPPPLPPKVVQ
jgi:ferric-dicitrate binding protein FerR (iron transport regulator)